MTAPKPSRKVQAILHALGLSCLGGSIFLQILVFTNILTNGYFMAVENNPTILAFEISFTAFSFFYFIYIYQRFIRSIKRP
jgi:hypothetical protein